MDAQTSASRGMLLNSDTLELKLVNFVIVFHLCLSADACSLCSINHIEEKFKADSFLVFHSWCLGISQISMLKSLIWPLFGCSKLLVS